MRDGRDRYPGYGRSREGAWIEINIEAHKGDKNVVAPVRERGLKLILKLTRVTRMLSLP